MKGKWKWVIWMSILAVLNAGCGVYSLSWRPDWRTAASWFVSGCCAMNAFWSTLHDDDDDGGRVV